MTDDNQVIIINPESVRIKTQEIIRMRNAARKSYGLIQNMTVEERTRRIVEIHAAVTKMKVFLQEMIVSEGEVLETLEEDERAKVRKLDREYKSSRGLSDEEKKEKQEKKAKKQSSLDALAATTGMSIEDMIKKLKG